jgi:hypothetical protein
MAETEKSVRRLQIRVQIKEIVRALGGEERPVPTAELYCMVAKIPGCEEMSPASIGNLLRGATDAGFILREGEDGNYLFRVAPNTPPVSKGIGMAGAALGAELTDSRYLSKRSEEQSALAHSRRVAIKCLVLIAINHPSED